MSDALLNPPKLIINVALTGIVSSKAQNPHLPVTEDEIVADAIRCGDAGASIIHIHARDATGSPAWQGEIYERIVSRIRRERPGLIICVTTSGRVFHDIDQRTASLRCNPEMASLTVGSLNFPKEASVNDIPTITALAERMNSHKPVRVVPELEFFELGMINTAKYLIRKGILQPPFFCNLLLGSLGTIGAEPHHLIAMVRELPPGAVWAAAGVGAYQFYINCLAISLGGHVRVGLEDSLHEDTQKTKLATNPGLIERLVSVAKAMGREIATPEDARQIIWREN